MDMKTGRLGNTSLCPELLLPTSGNASIPIPNYDKNFLEKPEQPGFSQFRKKANPPQTQSMQASSYTAMPLLN
jgi:hypothetical protein